MFFSCKEANKSTNLVFEAQCATGANGDNVSFKLFLSDTSVVLLPYQQDPHIWPLKGKDGQIKTSISLGNLSVEFSNRDSVVGYITQKTVSMDTIVNFDMEKKKEEISVVESVTLDTIGTCPFTKG